MNIDLTNQTILVTGAAGTGVGSGVCQAIAACGGRLIINDLDQEKVEAATRQYPEALGIAGDISQADQVAHLFSTAHRQGIVIHGLVNNAGVGLRKKVHRVDESEFDTLYNIDVKGGWLMARAFVNQLREHQAVGHIVNISSVHAQQSVPRYAVYASAKAAVEGLTRGMAIDLGSLGIRCNAVAPGFVNSEQNEAAIASWTNQPQAWVEEHRSQYQNLAHDILAIDCGHAVAFLLSDLSRSITGQTLTVDAGSTNLLYANQFIPESKS